MQYVWIEDASDKRTICQTVLNDLPEWFGIPSAVADYVKGVADKPFLAAYRGTEAVGFYALREENPHTLDMYVLGVKKAYRNQGLGSHMQNMVNQYAREKGYMYLVVLTLAAKAESEAYAQTRPFYEREGFFPVYQSDSIWDENNPAQIYLRQVERRSVRKGPSINLETQRLVVRPYEQSDLLDFHTIFSDPEVMDTCEPPYTSQQSEKALKYFSESRIAYAVERKKDRTVIGHLLFKQRPSEEKGIYEIGWIFNRSAWKQGFAFEAAKAVMDHGFKTLDVHKVLAETLDPHKSLPLMKKLGMTHEGTLRNHVKHNGKWRDLHVGGLLAHESRE